jgi:hypothetical protein
VLFAKYVVSTALQLLGQLGSCQTERLNVLHHLVSVTGLTSYSFCNGLVLCKLFSSLLELFSSLDIGFSDSIALLPCLLYLLINTEIMQP